MNRLVLIAAILAVFMSAAPSEAVLVHRYTFNNGNANDSVGTAHGTLADPTNIAKFIGGQLDVTANGTGGTFVASNTPGTGAYVSLPNGIITSALQTGAPNAMSVEMWVTVQENRFWARLFDFGTSNGGEDTSVAANETDYLQLVPQGFTSQFGFESHPAFADGVSIIGGTAVGPANTPLSTGVQHHIVVTYNQSDTTSGPGGTANVYLNNALYATGPIGPGMPLNSLTNENNDWLGRSQWNDPLFDGLYNEFRIYDNALSAGDVSASFAAGPVPPPFPTLVIDRSTGAITIQNSTGSSMQLTNYSISSAAGGLNVSPAWDPIAPAGGWTIQSQTASNLAEQGGTAVTLAASGGSQSLGSAWKKSKFEDLVFNFTLTGGTSGQAAVQFIGNGGNPFSRSDLDTDGDLDINDWNLFRAGTGGNYAAVSDVAAALAGDLNADNLTNFADLLVFRADYATANGPASLAELGPVPEPTSLAMGLVLLPGVARLVRRRR